MKGAGDWGRRSLSRLCSTAAEMATSPRSPSSSGRTGGVAARTCVRLGCRDVDDVVQAAFERILRAFRSGNGPRDHAGGYVMTVVRNVALSESAATLLPASWANAEEVGIEMVTNAEDVATHILAELSEPHRQLAWLHWVEDRPLNEIAPALGYPTPNAAAQCLQRTRIKLSAIFQRRGVI